MDIRKLDWLVPHRSISTELSIHLEISVLQVKKAGEELVNKRRGYSTEEDKKMKVTQLIIRTRSFSSIGRKRPKGIGDQYCNYCNLVMSHFIRTQVWELQILSTEF